jgi:PHP family Zn ribbon phosphoesterase
VAAHIDRPSYSIIGHLGFIPPDLEIDAVEYSPDADEKPNGAARAEWPVLSGSDAHKLEDIARAYSTLVLERISLKELRLALNNRAGRRVLDRPEPGETERHN